MKNKKFWEFLDKKGFYVVLFLCVATVMVTAGVITINNLNTLNKLNQEQNYVDLNEEFGDFDLETVDKNDQGQNPLQVTEEEANTAGAAIAETPPEIETVGDLDVEQAVEVSKPADQAIEEKPSQQTAEETKPTDVAQAAPKPEAPAQEKAEPKPQEKKPEVTSFKNGDMMKWPVVGEVVMDYSMDKFIWDATLEQYRNNSSLSIAAPAGTQVRAAAAGVVESILEDSRMGVTVTIDHGNGWKSTYGQLQKNVLVKQKDIVEQGQVIGGVGNPSNYAIYLGEHLEFSVAKDDKPTDPKELLEKQQ